MEAHTFLLHLVIILLAARICGELAAYCKIPSVIGEMLAGIIIGPSLLGWITISNPIHLLAEIGIVLLLFEVGTETDVKRLGKAGPKAALVALVGAVLPFAFGYGISQYIFQFSTLASLFIGCTLTATSIGITLRVLKELKKQDNHESQIILGAAVLDDIMGIILLSILYEFSSSGQIIWWNAAKVMVFISLFILIAPLAAKLVSRAIEQWEQASEIPGLVPTTIVSLILSFAWLAYYLGAPKLLGGFAAGLALSPQFAALTGSKDFNHRVEKQMRPIVHLFLPIFFVAIGLSIDLKSVDWHSYYIWILTGSLLVAAILGKLLAGFVLRGESRTTQLIIGTAMVPRGEVGLIFANVGLNAGVLTNEVYTSIILVIAITTLIAPFALRWLYK